MKHLFKYVFLTAGAVALLNGSVAFAEVNKCVGANGKVLYGKDCPYGTDEQKKLKGTVSVGDKVKGNPAPKTGPSITSIEDSRAKEPKLTGTKTTNPDAPLKE
jgi:hypothetical protein